MTKLARHQLLILCAVTVGSAQAATPFSAAAQSSVATANTRFRVAVGCDSPTIDPRQAHYVDPIRGNSAGDGSRSHPWGTLLDVLTTQRSHIHPGDVIYLASGNYGSVVATADDGGFVEVTAEKGQHPVLKSLEITGGHWIFSNLKIQSLRSQSPGGRIKALVNIHGGAKPANNIILDGNAISATDDASVWTPSDWLMNGLAGVKVEGGEDATSCIAITRNTLYATGGAANIGGGAAIQIYAGRALVADNIIDHFADDAIDYGADDLLISGNRITNNVGVDDGNHNDAMQGFVPGGQRYSSIHSYRNIVIDSNLIVRQTDPKLNQPVALQGIDNFGGVSTDWYDVRITNNVVITNTYHGITFGALHHGLIAHNTVLADGFGTIQRLYSADGRESKANAPGNQVWIMVIDRINHLSTTGGPSSDVLVESNIATMLQVVAAGAHVRHNLAVNTIALDSGGKPTFFRTAGEYGDHNVLDPTATLGFRNWQPSRFQFDLRPKRANLIGRGSNLKVFVEP